MAEEERLEFDWDASNLRHLTRHRISRVEFEEAMASDPIFVDFSDETGEERWYVLGATHSLRILFLVLTIRGDRFRPITGWDAGKKLREAYFRTRGR